MRILFPVVALMLLFAAGCVSSFGEQEVVFEFVNLSTNKIRSEAVKGLPPVVVGGSLLPSRDEERPDGTVVLFGPIKIPDQITMVWKENGAIRETQLKRSELGLPATLKNQKLRFAYLGNGKWRIKVLKPI
jgi:hypothetical protein